ncbi:hypothetical protein [Listeria rocourtiae]|uniref:hypothetical protein n=1 Tax=Listeria rocourtiae TaxID=647910 RepID=UPI001FCC05DE|nr:hypothetical protein [Listeria rocourtiae]
MTAWRTNTATIVAIICQLSDDGENPSIRFLVNSGMSSPAAVVTKLAKNPPMMTAFDGLVEMSSWKNCFQL